MERHREVFEDRSVTRIVLTAGQLARFTKMGLRGAVHVFCNDNTIKDVEGGDVLIPTVTVLNTDVPKIIERLRSGYPDERIYMLIRIIGPEDMSEVGFCSSDESLAFNPFGEVRCPEGGSEESRIATELQIKKTDETVVDLNLITEPVNVVRCASCLEVIQESCETQHCSVCGLAAHTGCVVTKGDKPVCPTCIGHESGALAKLRVSCADMIQNCPTLKAEEKTGLMTIVQRANGLRDLNKIVARFELTSLNSVPGLSNKELHIEQLREIFKEEVERYKKRILTALEDGLPIPVAPTSVLEFVISHKNMDKETVASFVEEVTSPLWIRQIVTAVLTASSRLLEDRYFSGLGQVLKKDERKVKRVVGDEEGKREEVIFSDGLNEKGQL